MTERWVGAYASSASTDCLIDQPDDATRLVLVTSGTGASTGFGIAEEVSRSADAKVSLLHGNTKLTTYRHKHLTASSSAGLAPCLTSAPARR